MKQIYNFDQHTPPVINENMLRNEMEKRKVEKQTAVLLLAGILIQIAVIMFGLCQINTYPVITMICNGYVVISILGSCILAIVCTRKGGNILWQQQV